MCTHCLLFPVLVGLICALLGYLLGRLLSKNSGEVNLLRSELDACKKEKEKQLALSSSYTNDIDSWKNKFNKLKADFDAYKLNSGSELQFSTAFDAALAKSVFGKKIVQDDLKIVEGIGPKIEQLFHNAGIKTWKALAETPVEKCQQILDNAGERYRVHNPGTWPKQCELAHSGKWKELKEWQSKLDGGKE